MHELGIVFHIVKTVEELAVENHVNRVNKVTLQVGEVSTVIPEYLVSCWNWKCSKSEIMQGCELDVEIIPAVTYCEDCQQTYGTVELGKICPHCGSEHTYLVQGNEHAIKEIEVYNDDEASDTPQVSADADGLERIPEQEESQE